MDDSVYNGPVINPGVKYVSIKHSMPCLIIRSPALSIRFLLFNVIGKPRLLGGSASGPSLRGSK